MLLRVFCSLILFFFLTGSTSAQTTYQLMSQQEYQLAIDDIFDTYRKAKELLTAGKPAATDSAVSALLKRYPLQPAYATGYRTADGKPHLDKVQNHPEDIYALRAYSREALGNYKGAEADITRALRGRPERFVSDTRIPYTRRDYLQLRARLRLDHLNDRTGGCSDLALLYQLDTAGVRNPKWQGCPLPKVKYVITQAERHEAELAAYDSLQLVVAAFKENRPATAFRTLDNLLNGRVGRFIGYWTEVSYLKELNLYQTGLLWGLRARAREALHDYKGAVADLDTAIIRQSNRCNTPGDGYWRYERGRIRIDYLNDRQGGCEDLAQAYRCDTTVTSRTHPRWRNCPLPLFKTAIGDEERKEAQAAFAAGIRLADTLLLQKQSERSLQVATGLVKGLAGRFEKTGLPGYGTYDYLLARSRRADALIELHRYPEARAELDTALLVGSHAPGIGALYCQRGLLRLEQLLDSSGCADLRLCYLNGYQPAKGNWRGCDFPEKTAFFHLSERFIHPVFDELTVWTPRLGLFYQGRAGAELGMLLSRGEWLDNWGPSLGLDVMAGNGIKSLLVAPKLAFEGQLGVVAGRLDFTYFGYMGMHDLRFTPQVGLSGLAVLNLLYGYSIPLLSGELPQLSRHRISLYINLVKISKIGG